MKDKRKEKIEYDKEIEELFISFLLSDREVFTRCKNIIDATHYNDPVNSKVITYLLEYANEYTDLPLAIDIEAISKKKYPIIDDMKESHRTAFLDKYEMFARHRQMENVIYGAPELLQQGRYGEVEAQIKQATEIALVKDIGLDYFHRPSDRMEEFKQSKGEITTGWLSVDKKLNGGIAKGTLSIFAGQSGSGKSLFLQNLAVNYAQCGMNVVYITLELSEFLCANRVDAMLTGLSTKDVVRDTLEAAMRVKSFHTRNPGNIQIKQLKNGCTANDIKAYCKTYEIQHERQVDVILVDYLDLMMPMGRNISASDLFVKDKYVSEELRNCAIDLNAILITASQLNRTSHETVEFDHSHISGGISKINTADNVMGIFTTTAMKENGKYQLQFLKTRSSSGVGSFIEMDFNPQSMRILDVQDTQPLTQSNVTKNLIKSVTNGGNAKTATVAPTQSNPSPGHKKVSGGNAALDKMKNLQDLLNNNTKK